MHEVLRITEPYKRASRTVRPDDTIVTLDDVRIGGDEVIVMAGPCSAETDDAGHGERGRGQARAGAGSCAAAPSSRAALLRASRALRRERDCRCCGALADAHNLKVDLRGDGRQARSS